MILAKNQSLTGRQGELQRGFSIVELLVTILISSILFGGMMLQYSEVVTKARDHQIRIETLVETQSIVQSMASELRMIGNGVPFNQPDFEIHEPNLSDLSVTEPIVFATSSESRIDFRLNETGEVLLLTANFNPASNLEVFLTDVSQLQANDPIYISNSVVAGDQGLYGTIASVNSGTSSVTLNSNYTTTPGATFAMGSILEEVPIISYISNPDGSGITRDSGYGPVEMCSKCSLDLDYLDYDGNPVELPLDAEKLVQFLRSIRITVTKHAGKKLSNGQEHSVTVSQIVGIRNLNLFF